MTRGPLLISRFDCGTELLVHSHSLVEKLTSAMSSVCSRDTLANVDIIVPLPRKREKHGSGKQKRNMYSQLCIMHCLAYRHQKEAHSTYSKPLSL
jgi:hypothetical protein